ncbi:restriction endonuclease subunit S [Bacteroides ovatus]|uniref:restriction endonuclease subunit S n=1 Tax=Bacteroides ovatus TaxID=28116 RepID=UPI0035A98A8F
MRTLRLRRGFFLSLTISDTPHYQNVPFEIPDNWVSVPVSELFYLNPKSEIADNIHIGFIPMACVDDGFSGNHYFEKRIWKEVKKGYCHFQNGDIGIAKISPCFENLKSTIFQGLPNNCGAGTTELVILRPINIYAKFYLYLFKSQWYIDEGTKYFKGVVGQQRVHKGIFTDLHIPLPPLVEQQRIVTEIEKWFALIDQIEQGKVDLQTTIKQTKSKILDLAIHGKLVPQDPNDEPSIELLQRINPDFTPCDNGHYQNLPAGWAMCKLSDLCRIENGFAFSSNDYKPQGIPLVRISNIIHNTIDITDCVYIEGITDNKLKISKGDLLIAMSGATTGKMGVYPFDETAYLNQRVGNIKILNKSSLSPVYRNTYMQSKVDEILKIAYGGAQPNISASIIGNFDFPLPPYKEQIRIVETVQRIFDQLDVITKSL